MNGDARGSEELNVGGDAPARGEGSDNLLSLVHRQLRGRYPLAIVLGLAFMLPCAWIGYTAKEPEYVSQGLVQVRTQLPQVLYNTPEGGSLQHYESFIDTQAKLMESRRVLDAANKNRDLQAAGWESGADGVNRLRRMMAVSHPRRSELIELRVAHSDPRIAQAAVNAILDSYYEIYGERDSLAVSARQQALDRRAQKLRSDIQLKRDEIFVESEEYGANMLDRLHEAKLDELDRLNEQLSEIDAALADADLRGESAHDPAIDGEKEITAETLASLDPEVEQLRSRARSLESLIGGDSKYGPNHRVTKQRRAELETVRNQLQSRIADIKEQAGSGMLPTGARSQQLGRFSAERLRELKSQYTALRDSVQDEAVSLGKRVLEIKRLEEEITDLRKYLDDTTKALEAIKVEEENLRGGRVAIAQRGDLPTEAHDQRKIMAAAGGAFGFGAGFGLVFLLGFFDRGYRYIDEVERGDLSAPLLGTLPDLNVRHPEHDEMAALSVHHLRNMLVLGEGRGAKGCRVFTMTSAAAGDGKTSLTLALGMSFAVSGNRTLMMDADLVGRGLSRELGLDNEPGLCQAVETEALNGEIQRTSINNLWAMPAGKREAFEAKHLSEESVRAVIGQLREQFDTILIDTGPVLGSLEANLAAVNSDGVLLTIARGQSRRLVEACLERLRRMDVRCAGLVFNRATAHDFDNSISAASVVSQSLKAPGGSEAGRPRRNTTGRGLLVRAVIGEESESES